MNIKLLLALSLVGAAYAQTNLENNHLDRLSPKAREFVEKYKAEKANKKINGNAQKRKVILKSDVLGRKLNRGQIQDSTVYIIEDNIEPRMEVTVADLTVEDVDIEPISAQYSYNDEKKEEIFWLNGKEIDKKSFYKKVGDWDNRRKKLQKPLKQPYKAFLTPTEIENKLLSSDDVYIETEDVEVAENFIPYQNGAISTYYATYDEALIISGIGSGFTIGDKGNGVGVYIMDHGCVNASQIPNPLLLQLKACDWSNPERLNDPHPVQVTSVLQTYAPEAFVYSYDALKLQNDLGPAKPQTFNPEIYIGNISVVLYQSKVTANYEIWDSYLDNYIWTNGVTVFVSAGNFKSHLQSQPTIHSPGKALNAITVGSYNPYPYYLNGNTVPTYIYEEYSNYINSNIGNAKPEIMNIGNLFLPNGISCLGTSCASPFSAAMAANLMTKHPFFRGHPEMVKPVFMTSTWGTTFNNRDTDGGAVEGIPHYPFMVNNKSFSGWWKGNDKALFKDANGNDKSLEVDIINGVVAGEKYKLGVSWLMKGSTIKSKGKLPVNLAVLVYQNGQIIAGSLDVSNKNPFALIPFTVPQSGSVKIVIVRLGNLAPNDQIAIGYHMARQRTP